MPGIFDSKNFNAEVFQGYVESIPNLNRNELIRSRALRPRPDLASAMAEQTGGNYITTPLFGLIDGDAQNYDGATNITSAATKTFTHSRVVVGRAKSWVERDFSYDITGGVDFTENIARQLSEYWENLWQGTIIKILNGVFAMNSGAANVEFVTLHTADITGNETPTMNATTLNSAMQRACGDNKGRFSLAIMHSAIATGLENLNLLSYLKYTDASGMERDLAIGTLNGRTVLVDDSMPAVEVAAVYALTTDTEIDATKTYYTRSGSEGSYVYTTVDSPVKASLGTYYEKTADAYTAYTTYVLGDGAIEYTDCGAKVPYEVERDAATNGGQDKLFSRQRHCYAPFGISFTKSSMSSASPTDAELETGANWELVNTGGDTKEYINHKSIPIARIISRA